MNLFRISAKYVQNPNSCVHTEFSIANDIDGIYIFCGSVVFHQREWIDFKDALKLSPAFGQTIFIEESK